MEVKNMLGTCQVGKTSHPRDLTPGRTAATRADVYIAKCSHTVEERGAVQYIYTCTRTSTDMRALAPSLSREPPPHRHMQSHRFDKLSGCQQMLNLLRSLIPPPCTCIHTHSPPNTHVHTLTKHIQTRTHTHILCTYFIFSTPTFLPELAFAAAVLMPCRVRVGLFTLLELSKDRTTVCVSASVTHKSPSARDGRRAAVFSDLLPTSFWLGC